MKSIACAAFVLLNLGLSAQTEVWTALSAKYDLSKRWNLGASFESRWRNSGYQQFSDLRLTREAKDRIKYFYEFRAPLNALANPRHTLAIEKGFKVKWNSHKIADVTFGTRYHVNRGARVRWGIYAERKLGDWIPELGAEAWTASLAPWSTTRRLRGTAALNWEPNKTWKFTAGWSQQSDFGRNGSLNATFGIVRLGARIKL
jgi:hypothetical protein